MNSNIKKLASLSKGRRKHSGVSYRKSWGGGGGVYKNNQTEKTIYKAAKGKGKHRLSKEETGKPQGKQDILKR